MENLDEALRNIDIFCRILVKKIVEDEDNSEAEVSIGDNVSVKEDVVVTIKGSGKFIVENGVVFSRYQEFNIGDGEVVRIPKNDPTRVKEGKILLASQIKKIIEDTGTEIKNLTASEFRNKFLPVLKPIETYLHREHPESR